MAETFVGVVRAALRSAGRVGAWLNRRLTKAGLSVPAQFQDIIRAQTRTLRFIGCAIAACGTNAIVLVMADFRHQLGLIGAMVGGGIVLTYATWVALVFLVRNGPAFIRISVALLFVLGALWGTMVYHLSVVAIGQQSNVVVTLALGLVSTPMLSAPFSIAFAFWLPVAIGCAAAIALGLHGADPYNTATIIGYEILVLVGIVVINRTLLQLSIARVELRMQNETVGLLLKDYEENAADWLWETDAQHRLRRITARFAQVLRLPATELEGRALMDILRLDLGSVSGFEAGDLLHAMETRRSFRDVPIRVRIGKEDRWLSMTGRPVEGPGAVFAGFRGVGSDITESKRAAEETQYLATHDPLTGLGNRRMFLESLERACATSLDRPTRPFALLMLDLDRFKEVNDDHGHSSGDTVLVETASRLRRNMRVCDTVARLGGDEFALIMPDASGRDALSKAERLIEVVSERIRAGDVWLSVGASIGIACFPGDGHAMSDIMRSADLALYRAKEGGRGTSRLFDPSFAVEFHDRIALLTELRGAINTPAFRIEYQPILRLETGNIVAMEALCRWTHPERGTIPPATFIPLAEECGLIRKLGRRILLESCREATAWSPDIAVSVNLSPIQLKDAFLVDIVQDVLSETKLDPRRLELEITESTWLEADALTTRHVQALSALGARIILDDFGTGFSSLSTLRNFCFHGLKVDKEFVRDIEVDPKAEAIMRLVSAMAVELGVSMTAEGIETEGQLRLIRQFGVARAQGYLFGLPGPSSLAPHPVRLALAG